jgi:hypothetical protein
MELATVVHVQRSHRKQTHDNNGEFLFVVFLFSSSSSLDKNNVRTDEDTLNRHLEALLFVVLHLVGVDLV